MRVLVYPSWRTLRLGLDGMAVTNNWWHTLGNRRTYGRTITFTAPARDGEVGVVAMARQAGAGIVAHEMLHVAWHWLSRRRAKLDVRRDEERVAYLLQSLVSQYWVGYRAREEREDGDR